MQRLLSKRHKKGLKPKRPRFSRTIAGMMAFAMGLSASAAAPSIQEAKPETKNKKTSTHKNWLQTGIASWYGRQFQGRKTANGEKFDMNTLTCAHRSLPLGSWVRVTNLKNMKSIFVRVNDRGPVPEDRIIDLSYAAAQAVGISGLGKVRLEPVRAGDVEAAKAMVAQLNRPTLGPTNFGQ